MNLFVCPAKCNKGFVFFMLLWITQNSWCSGEKCSSKWLILFVFAAEQQFYCNELTILNLIPTNSWWWDLHTITPKYKTELLNAVTGSGVRANSDNVCISGAGWADAGYSWSRFVKMSALLRIGLKLAWTRHLKLHIFLMHWSEFSINLSSALSLLKCLGLGVMKMMNRAIKIMFRREKCIIYHYCLIAEYSNYFNPSVSS